jgi:hypothetical protein
LAHNFKGSEETPEDAIKEAGHLMNMNLGVSTEDICLSVFAATEFNKTFSTRQPHQGVEVLCFRN